MKENERKKAVPHQEHRDFCIWSTEVSGKGTGDGGLQHTTITMTTLMAFNVVAVVGIAEEKKG